MGVSIKNQQSSIAYGTSVTTPLLPPPSLSAYAGDSTHPAYGFTSTLWISDGRRRRVALLGAYALLRRKPKSADDLERERRAWLEGTGRITDGTVIDVQELAPEAKRRSAVMLIYKYDVAGVSYECSQDVTYLRQWINLHSCRLGLHTSVKYDPQNPGNSLVVSENWMGLRQ